METGSPGQNEREGKRKRFTVDPSMVHLYCEMWKEYRAAGSPFGACDLGMLIWFEFEQQTRLN